MLVRPTRDGEGFVDFAFETFDEAAGHFESAISWHEKAWHLPLSRPGTNVLTVVQGDGVRMPGDRVRRGGDAPVPGAARGRRDDPSTSRSSASHRWGSRTASRRGSTLREDASRTSPTSSGARTRRAPSPHSTPRSSRGSSPRRGRSSLRPWARASWWGSRCIGSERPYCFGGGNRRLAVAHACGHGSSSWVGPSAGGAAAGRSCTRASWRAPWSSGHTRPAGLGSPLSGACASRTTRPLRARRDPRRPRHRVHGRLRALPGLAARRHPPRSGGSRAPIPTPRARSSPGSTGSSATSRPGSGRPSTP